MPPGVAAPGARSASRAPFGTRRPILASRLLPSRPDGWWDPGDAPSGGPNTGVRVWGSAATLRAVSGHGARPKWACLLGRLRTPKVLGSDSEARTQGTRQVWDTRPARVPQDTAVWEVLSACCRRVTGYTLSIVCISLCVPRITHWHTCRVSISRSDPTEQAAHLPGGPGQRGSQAT